MLGTGIKTTQTVLRNEVIYLVYSAINGLIRHAIESELITNDDVFVVRNQLMDILRLKDWIDAEPLTGNIEELLEPLIDHAVQLGIIDNTSIQRDLFDTKIMGVFSPMPREVNAKFQRKYSISPSAATQWYYAFSKNLNYVRAERIKKDLKWTYESEYGILDITINRSKPEKDPRDITAAKTQKISNYPKCQLCAENMGFAGHLTHPARQNLRPVKLTINNQDWFMQYSPYGYYNEHCIVFNKNHVPMVINEQVFNKLLDFVEQFPHYFIGSNADLPIVGGSILTHEHFQGGNYTFAMEKAPIETPFKINKYPNVSAGILKWPMSVIRLSSDDKKELINACCDILNTWQNYSDESVGILAKTNGIPHNTITPIARATPSGFECDLVLRNNITTKERPLGVFHPNPTLHHIKKENIGLIEVMGLAVLPSRLAEELDILCESIILDKDLTANPKTALHNEWVKDILKNHPEINFDNVHSIIKSEVGNIFEQVLLDAGVFKRDKQGKEAFYKFISIFL